MVNAPLVIVSLCLVYIVLMRLSDGASLFELFQALTTGKGIRDEMLVACSDILFARLVIIITLIVNIGSMIWGR